MGGGGLVTCWALTLVGLFRGGRTALKDGLLGLVEGVPGEVESVSRGDTTGDRQMQSRT